MFEVHIFLYGILKRNYIQTHPRPNFAGNPAEEPDKSSDGQAIAEPFADHNHLRGREHLCQRHLPGYQGTETRDHVSFRQHIRCLDIFISSCFFLVRILVQAFLTLAGILVETGETYYSCLENDL